jgi:hypothetical protein
MHDLAGNGPIIQTVMTQTWELLNEEQKKEVAVRRMDKAIKFLEMKIFGAVGIIENNRFS